MDGFALEPPMLPIEFFDVGVKHVIDRFIGHVSKYYVSAQLHT